MDTEELLNLPFIIAVVLVPLVAGAAVFLLVFRRVHRKYLTTFQKLVDVAREQPAEVRRLLSGTEKEKNAVVAAMQGIERVRKVEIIKAGRELTTLYLTALQHGAEQPVVYEVLLQLEGQWSIRRFAPLGQYSQEGA